MTHPSEADRKAAEEWIRNNDWDYQKYDDRRPDRSAYDTRMLYEISDLLEWAFLAGCAHKEQEITKLREALKKVAEANCPIYIAHPQSVWWEQHVVKHAKEALQKNGGENV